MSKIKLGLEGQKEGQSNLNQRYNMHRDTKQNTRRSFIKGSAAAATATLAASATAVAEGGMPEALRGLDHSVGGVLATYCSACTVEKRGKKAFVKVEVTDFKRYVRSFERLAGVSERVYVERNEVTVTQGETTYHISNRIS